VGIVLVDLWGATAATHDALTGTPGSYERTVAGLQRLVPPASRRTRCSS
jgi:hypothetical protein